MALTPVVNVLKTFFFVSDEEAKIVFVLGKPFQPCLIFVSRARAHLSEAHFRLISDGQARSLLIREVPERCSTQAGQSYLQA
jgi:hypothetical protein